MLEISLEKQNSKKKVLVLCVKSVDEYRLCSVYIYIRPVVVGLNLGYNQFIESDITITYGHIIHGRQVLRFVYFCNETK